MRTLVSSTILAALVLTMQASAWADEAPDLYLEGYRAWMAGEALMAKGNNAAALEKLKTAEDRIAGIQKRFPDWEPEVVKYRLAHIRKKLAELTPPTQAAEPAPTMPPVPTIPTVKPPAMYFQRPTVPFPFNGEIYFKMLLSSQSEAASALKP